MLYLSISLVIIFILFIIFKPEFIIKHIHKTYQIYEVTESTTPAKVLADVDKKIIEESTEEVKEEVNKKPEDPDIITATIGAMQEFLSGGVSKNDK